MIICIQRTGATYVISEQEKVTKEDGRLTASGDCCLMKEMDGHFWRLKVIDHGKYAGGKRLMWSRIDGTGDPRPVEEKEKDNG